MIVLVHKVVYSGPFSTFEGPFFSTIVPSVLRAVPLASLQSSHAFSSWKGFGVLAARPPTGIVRQIVLHIVPQTVLGIVLRRVSSGLSGS